jgi:hypothetical protein
MAGVDMINNIDHVELPSMNLREYFAGLICASMWGNPESIKAMLSAAGPGIESLARAAVQQTDALIKELSREQDSE